MWLILAIAADCGESSGIAVPGAARSQKGLARLRLTSMDNPRVNRDWGRRRWRLWLPAALLHSSRPPSSALLPLPPPPLAGLLLR